MQETPQQYTARILGYVEGKNPLQIERSTPRKLAAIVSRLSRKQLMQRPAPDRWSIAEILAHLADAELVRGWRMRLVIAENGATIQAFDQDVWARIFDYRRRDPRISLEMFRVLRESNLALLKSLPKKLWENYGLHQERGKESLTRIVQMFAGHDLNHLRQVEEIAGQARKAKKRA